MLHPVDYVRRSIRVACAQSARELSDPAPSLLSSLMLDDLDASSSSDAGASDSTAGGRRKRSRRFALVGVLPQADEESDSADDLTDSSDMWWTVPVRSVRRAAEVAAVRVHDVRRGQRLRPLPPVLPGARTVAAAAAAA